VLGKGSSLTEPRAYKDYFAYTDLDILFLKIATLLPFYYSIIMYLACTYPPDVTIDDDAIATVKAEELEL